MKRWNKNSPLYLAGIATAIVLGGAIAISAWTDERSYVQKSNADVQEAARTMKSSADLNAAVAKFHQLTQRDLHDIDVDMEAMKLGETPEAREERHERRDIARIRAALEAQADKNP